MIIIARTEMGLAIVVQEKTKKILKAADAIQAADDYLAATDGMFGNVEWEYVGHVRIANKEIITYYKHKPRED